VIKPAVGTSAVGRPDTDPEPGPGAALNFDETSFWLGLDLLTEGTARCRPTAQDPRSRCR
jgi:hypothetical protein